MSDVLLSLFQIVEEENGVKKVYPVGRIGRQSRVGGPDILARGNICALDSN